MKINKRRLRYLPDKVYEKGKTYKKRESDPFYNSVRWRRVRKQFINDYPICGYCPTIKTATVVDHLRPRRLWPSLEWDTENYVPCCYSCHAKKTGYESNIETQDDWEHKMKSWVFKADLFFKKYL